MVHRKLEKCYFQEVRPAIKRKEDVGEESDKNAPVLSVTDEEDIAGPNAGSEDDAEEKKTTSKTQEKIKCC